MHCVRMFVSYGILGLFLFFLMAAGETEEVDLTEEYLSCKHKELSSHRSTYI